MSIGFRAMREGEENAVAAMIRQLPKDLGLDVAPALTGEMLREVQGLVHVTVADNSGLLLGASLWTIIFSTWRGLKGMYVCDLYVMSHERGKKTGERLLRAAAKDAEKLGAKYIKLETNVKNPRPTQFYSKLNFMIDKNDHLMFLEPDEFQNFIGENR